MLATPFRAMKKLIADSDLQVCSSWPHPALRYRTRRWAVPICVRHSLALYMPIIGARVPIHSVSCAFERAFFSMQHYAAANDEVSMKTYVGLINFINVSSRI